MVSPYTVIPGTVAGGSILLHPSVRPYTVRPRTVGRPDWDAQRFYFRATAAAEVSPDWDVGWDDTTGAVRTLLAPTASAADTITAGLQYPFTSGQILSDRQLVSPMLRGGVSFDGATVSCVLRVREFDAAQNVTSRMGLRVVSADGAIERAVLLAVGAYGTQLEYVVNPSPAASRVFASAESLASYVTQPGDRLVLELGAGDTGGTNPRFQGLYGSSNATDLALSDGLAGANAWMEITPAA